MATTTTTITDQGSIAAFNRGPLTSVFTPPATCLSTLTFINDMYFGHRDAYFDTACFPASISATQTQQSTSDTWALYYYSPGQCPSGWSHATTISSYFSGADESPYVLSLGADTTAVLCCPSGFMYPSGGQGHQCLSTLSTGTLTYFSPSVVQNTLVQGSVATTTIGTTSGTISSTTLYNVYGDGIPVWWQSSDLAAFSAASLTTSSSSSSTPTTTATSSTIFSTSTPAAPGTSSPSPPSPGPSGLSTGAKAAIGVCISLTFVAILAGLAYYYFRYRKGKEQHHQVPPSEEHFNNISMIEGPEVQTFSGSVHELPHDRPAAEMGLNERTIHLGTGQQPPFTLYR